MLMLAINNLKPHYAKMCALRMKASNSLDLATNATAEAVVAYMTADNLDVDGITKRGKAKKHS